MLSGFQFQRVRERRSNPCLRLRHDDYFAEPVIGRAFALTRWLAMTGYAEIAFAEST